LHESCLDNFSLICPRCRQAGNKQIIQSPLKIDSILIQQAGYIIEGFLICSNQKCRTLFPIIAGVPIIIKDLANWYRTERIFLVQPGGMGPELSAFFQKLELAEPDIFNRQLQLGAYLDAHYYLPSEIESEQPTVHQQFWQHLQTLAAPSASTHYSRTLDLGCSVGRFTFELAGFSDLAIGLDIDFPAVAQAASFQRMTCVQFARKERSKKVSDYTSPFKPKDNVLFLVGDALDPPFTAESFDLVSGINLLDNVSIPLLLIGQMNALLRQQGILLHCSPYAWRANIADPAEWLETEDIAAPDLLRMILSEQYFPDLEMQYRILNEIEAVPWVLDYGQRQKSVFTAHLLSAQKISGSNL